MKKTIYYILLCVFLFPLQACSSKEKEEITSNTIQEIGTYQTITYEEEDLDTSYDKSTAHTIELNNEQTKLSISEAEIQGSTLTIKQAGTYVLQGQWQGQIAVDAPKDALVKLVLKGVIIQNLQNAALVSKSARKTVILLEEGSENIFEDYSSYQDTTIDALIYAKTNLTLQGNGSLTLIARYKDAIKGNDDLVITGGNYHIQAVEDGIIGKDSLAIYDGNFQIISGKDALKSSNNQDISKGWISIENGSYTLTAGNDSIQAETFLQIQSGHFQIETKTDTIDETISYKALKAGTLLFVKDGNYQIQSVDDALHSNQHMVLENGTFTISSNGNGIHADDTLQVLNASIHVTNSVEGMEAQRIEVYGGQINITANDDGINATGTDPHIQIDGGEIIVDAQGDGIDSNGTITQTGGTLILFGPTDNQNSALDYDVSYTLEGGVLLASGPAQMSQTVSSSTQPVVMIQFHQIRQANSIVNISDTQGNSLITFAPNKQYQNLIISLPSFTKDTAYQLSVDGNIQGEISNGNYGSATYEGGTLKTSFTFNENILSILEDGSSLSLKQPTGMGEKGQRPDAPTPPEGSNMPPMQEKPKWEEPKIYE